ncbi:hypothetical protein Aduo_018712 [Ancylostoma duodenale]
MPMDVYEQPPSSSYLRLSYHRTLFPKVSLSKNVPVLSIPRVEMQHEGETIAFRQRSDYVLQSTVDNIYEDIDVNNVLKVPDGVHDMVLILPIINYV